MYIKLRYGKDQTLILNPECGSTNFMLHLQKILNDEGIYINDDVNDLDICDSQGMVKGIRNMAAMERVSTVISSKEVYVPVMVQSYSTDSEEITDFHLLLSSEDKAIEKLKQKLQKQKVITRLSTPDRRHSRTRREDTSRLGGSSHRSVGRHPPRAKSRNGR